MERSIALVGDTLAELSASAARGEPITTQIAIGRRAERRMVARLGANTHRGAIFLGGALLLARHRSPSDDERALRLAVSSVAGEVAAAGAPRGTHGAAARARFRVGGVLGEVGAGLPSVFEVAVPAFRSAVARGEDGATASFRMLAALMRTVEDTTALHRCGHAGLAQIRADGAALEGLVTAGTHVPFLRHRNALYRRLNLTMGGVADLLGAAFAWLLYRGELRSVEEPRRLDLHPLDRLPGREPPVQGVPVRDRGLAELPAQEDGLVLPHRVEVDQAGLDVLEDAPEGADALHRRGHLLGEAAQPLGVAFPGRGRRLPVQDGPGGVGAADDVDGPLQLGAQARQ